MSNETKKNEVTLTREEFRDIAMEVVASGEFITKMKREKPEVAFTLMLAGIPVISELENRFFGKEDNNNE